MIFGHSHEWAFLNYKNGRYINLGSWIEAPCYGKFDSNGFEIVDWS
ncbi:MAG: hypothetical protein P8Y79_16060 [Ignavibacteriaceae bacterium]